MINLIVRLEGLLVFIVSLYFYYLLELSWLAFVVLLFLPDISMLGYLKDRKLGSITYNFVHNYIFAIVLLITGIGLELDLLLSLGIILFAHIGIDRFLGFGLKYQTDFKATHIQKI